ncbi:M24 family metallopeptidase [Streptomyces sp. GQFP]|uniref:M24 family metallopeptidase n=1 Tax=Streptomyces sp. GQFP TaxID=2907545 RepID=UPI001F157776|nr:M24 family metallopeptidase [Streptomyces sp. GQFP]UIX29320.1 M24 family metallopeptidase [Streptomyces sp. GQFP]
MRISMEEIAHRRSRAQAILEERGLDAMVVRGATQSPEMIYLTGAWMPSHDTYYLLSREGVNELVVRGFRPSSTEQIAGGSLEVVHEQPGRTPVPTRVVDWLAAQGARRVGVSVGDGDTAPWVTALGEAGSGIETHSVLHDVQALRYVKSKEELEILRTSAQLADEVWEKAAEFVRVGRSPRQILGDIQHYLVSHGCDAPLDAYYGSLVVILFPTPLLNWYRMSEPLAEGDIFSLEISPRIQGYYSQLTGAISIGQADPEIQRSHDSIVKARRASLEYVRAGVDARTAAKAMTESLAADGYSSTDGNIGHLLGLDITEPRVGTEPFRFEPGMTLVAHPMLRSDHVDMMLSGETYLVTEGEPERLQATSLDGIREL